MISRQSLAKGYKYLAIEVWLLIALGGAVRAMNAGLACPDWPLCFGDYIPDYHPQVYFEFIHRVMAGLVSLSTLFLAIGVFLLPQPPKRARGLAVFGLVMIVAQVVLGGLTVLWQLHDKVVAAHLAMGTAFFASLLWLNQELRASSEQPDADVASDLQRGLLGWSIGLATAVFVQIMLGGLVASNYAALVCPDFPMCQGQWVPTWAGPVGLQVLHRFSAYLVATVALLYAVRFRRRARILAVLVLAQIALGAANVLLRTPPIVTVAHLAMAESIWALVMMQVFRAQSVGQTKSG